MDIEFILEPLKLQDTQQLMARIKDLKQRDGESWAIGEVIERCLESLKRLPAPHQG